MDLTGHIRKKLSLFILLISIGLGMGCSHGSGDDSYLADFPFSEEGRVHPQLFERLDSQWIASAYFDQGMHTQGSQFRTVALAELIRKFRPENHWDALLLDCHDDYQGHYIYRRYTEVRSSAGAGDEVGVEAQTARLAESDGGDRPRFERSSASGTVHDGEYPGS